MIAIIICTVTDKDINVWLCSTCLWVLCVCYIIVSAHTLYCLGCHSIAATLVSVRLLSNIITVKYCSNYVTVTRIAKVHTHIHTQSLQYTHCSDHPPIFLSCTVVLSRDDRQNGLVWDMVHTYSHFMHSKHTQCMYVYCGIHNTQHM